MPDGKPQISRESIIRKALDARHQMSFVVTRAKAVDSDDETNRTVEIICATDKPITHFLWSKWDYVDISIVMEKSAMRAERFENGAAFLMDHNTRDQRGVIESFSLEKGELHAVVRMSKSERGEELYQDILDGIRQQISLGFMIHKLTLVEERENEPDLYEARDWEPYEASSVAVAADLDAKVMRAVAARRDGLTNCPDCNAALSECVCDESKISNAQKRAISTNGENKMTPEEIAAQKAVEETRALELADARRKDVLGFADIYGERELAESLLLTKPEATQEDIRLAIVAKREKDPPAPKVPVESPEAIAARNGIKPTLARIIPRHSPVTAFKGEDKVERAYRFGMWALGRALFKPESAVHVAAKKYCDENGLTRAMGEDVNETGGYLVPTEFSNELIDLREQYGVFRRYAKVEPMASDTKIIPRRSSGLTAYFVAEAGAITASDAGWDQIELVAKKLAVLARYSSEVTEDSIIDFGNTLAGEIAYAFANKEDDCGFNGDGTSTYGGIVGIRGGLRAVDATIANIDGLKVGTGNAYSELVLADFRGTVALLPQYADTPQAAWFVHRSFYWNVMVAALLAAGGVTAMEIEEARREKFLGYPVVFTQVMPSVEANSQICAILGDLSKGAILGTRRDTTIAYSEHSRFANDQIEIRGTERFDISCHGVGDTSAPGPIVGLITAAA